MSYINPTVSEFKAYFTRDFPFGSDPTENVLDSDISKAMDQASININGELFSSQTAYSIGFNLLSAHFLVSNLRASSQGLSGQYSWLQNSRSVGSVSEGLSIPDRIMQNPYLAAISKTNYGAEYLMLIFPKLTGQIFSVKGGTRA